MTVVAHRPTPILLPTALAVPPHSLREAWLQAAVEALRPLFLVKNHYIPPCQVSVGFASTGNHLGHIGQCRSTDSSAVPVNQIFISPTLSDAYEMLNTLADELVHAVDDCKNKHGKEFKKIALRLGLKGPMRSAGAQSKDAGTSAATRRLPHAYLAVSMKKAVHRTHPRANCKTCSFQVPMLKRFLYLARLSARRIRSRWRLWGIGTQANGALRTSPSGCGRPSSKLRCIRTAQLDSL